MTAMTCAQCSEAFPDTLCSQLNGCPRTDENHATLWNGDVIYSTPSTPQQPSDQSSTEKLTENPKAAFGAAKAPFFGIPMQAITQLGLVMAGGAHKYGKYNYRETRIAASTYHDAILRHFMLWADGEDIDPESKAQHLGHIMACCALMIDAEANDMLDDDRNKAGTMRDMLDQSAEAFKSFKEDYDAEKGTS